MLNRLIQNRLILIVASLTLFFLTLSVFNKDRIHQKWQDFRPTSQTEPVGKKQHPPWVMKPVPEQAEAPGIVDNFPPLMHGPPLMAPAWNIAPPHSERTPLLIGFTRNWRILQQCVVSYIAAGWPPNEIFVVENTGVMDNNAKGRLDLQNPFFLNHTRLNQLGVNVVRTPTLLNFAQLQNFYINFAVDGGYDYYFWSHMDVVALSDESQDSLFQRALATQREWAAKKDEKWGALWFAYDHLTLVNTATYLDLGGWDTFIGYYMTDCDLHERVMMKGYKFHNAKVGFVYDVARTFDDLSIFFRQGATKNDDSYKELHEKCEQMMHDKLEDKRGRNIWQERQSGGQSDPFYRDPKAFEDSILMAIEQGKDIFREKWGYRECDLIDNGLKLDMAWKVEKDWSGPPRI